MIRKILALIALMGLLAFAPASMAADKNAGKALDKPADKAVAAANAASPGYLLGAGDALRISVFQNPDLSLETRVAEDGTISFPLIGIVKVGGLSLNAAEKAIADKLKNGKFVKQPQVNIALTEVRGSQIGVLGLVGKPGRYPLEASSARLTDIIAQAGGVVPEAGGGTAVVTGNRDGKPFRQEVDLVGLFSDESGQANMKLKNGDVVYVTPGNQVSVLGMVNKPGRFPIENSKMYITDVLTLAGGLTSGATDIAILSGQRDGKPFRKEVDLAAIYLNGTPDANVLVAAGDEVYVHRAPVFYIYGEAQKPGAYRIERNMTVIQALAQGGGPTNRGTERGLKLVRKTPDGGTKELSPKMTDLVQPDDVIYVRESLF
jgi:polysaccharide export outer membrane protein